MTRQKDKAVVDTSRQKPAEEPTERELSHRQAMENAASARATHRSGIPGVDDDSEAIQGWAAALAAPGRAEHDPKQWLKTG